MKVGVTFILVFAFLLLLVHGIWTYANSPHCNNYQNRACAAAAWKVWEW